MFKPMKAEAPEVDKFPLVFPFLASPKIDGIRCAITPDGARTNSLKPFPNRRLQEMLSTLPVGLDGELTPCDPHKSASNIATSVVMAHDADITQVQFHVFDKCDSFSNSQMPFALRLMEAERAVNAYRRSDGPAYVKFVEHKMVVTQSDLEKLRAEHYEFGFEGTMLRKPGGLYKFGRSTAKQQDLLKFKYWEDMEGPVLDAYEENENTNEQTTNELGRSQRSSHKAGKIGKGTLGGVTVGLGPPWKSKTVDVGGGWTAKQRAELWAAWLADPEAFKRLICKFKYQPEGSKDKPRHPVWLDWRHPEDMS